MLREETACWLCGRAGTALDPLVADHVVPRAKDGTNERSNYRAAHRQALGLAEPERDAATWVGTPAHQEQQRREREEARERFRRERGVWPSW